MALVTGTEGMRNAAQALALSLTPRVRALVIALSGDLGAGKTALAQALARELGVIETVTSPTFIIERVYALPKELGRGFSRLIHIDAYRLESESELEHLGWKEMLSDPQNLILVEWPERVVSLIPSDSLRVTLSYIDEQSRDITYGNS